MDRIVWQLLGDSATWKRWYSLSGLLPVLAEASPEVFLRCIEADLVRREPHVVVLFADEGHFGGSRHTGLLWALENLAWFPCYLGRVAKLLAKLAAVDPGGRTANRPQSSLREIFLTWKPQTAASLDERLEVLDSLCRLQDEIGWKLIVDLLPKSHDHGIPTHQPRWREIPEIPTITTAEYHAAQNAIVERAVNLAGNRAEQLVELISHMADFPASGREDVLRALDRFASSPSFTNEKTARVGAVPRLLAPPPMVPNK